MLTGEVKLSRKTEESFVPFSSLMEGEGVINRGETRIKVKHDAYLHFTNTGLVFSNCGTNWPPGICGRVGKFRLIAEEVR